MNNYNELILPKGSDQNFIIEFTDKDAQPINLTVFSNVMVILYNKDKTIIDKYSVDAAAGWKSLTIGGTFSNELSFTLQTTETNLAKNAIVLYEIRIQKTDETVSDGKYDTIVNDEYLCTITDSVTSTLTLP